MWEPIPNFEKYEVSDSGVVRRKDSGRIVKQTADKEGYMLVCLYDKPKRKTAYVHRLVAAAFIPNGDDLPTVHHIDSDKANNNVKNLMWASCRQQSLARHGHTVKTKVYTLPANVRVLAEQAIADNVLSQTDIEQLFDVKL